MTTNVVKNYLNHDMIHLPINITNSHWYLASINVEKREIQVLDSLCWKFNRGDLTTTLQGLQYHLDILKSQENLCNYKWKDLDVIKWKITEQLQKPIQKDRAFSSQCNNNWRLLQVENRASRDVQFEIRSNCRWPDRHLNRHIHDLSVGDPFRKMPECCSRL